MHRPRRTCHAVPGSSDRFIAKAADLDADESSSTSKTRWPRTRRTPPRARVVEALKTSTSGPRPSPSASTEPIRRTTTRTIAVVEQAGHELDVIMLPKVQTAGDVEMTASSSRSSSSRTTSKVGGSASRRRSRTRRLLACATIAAASQRMETLIFGPGDYSAAIGIPITTIGSAPAGYPGDHLNYVYTKLLVAARAAGIDAIDGPYARVDDTEGLLKRSQLVRALGSTANGPSTQARSKPSTACSAPAARRGSALKR